MFVKVFLLICLTTYTQAGYLDSHGSYATSYSSSNLGGHVAAPAYGYAAAPVVSNYATPVVTKYATPIVAKAVAPVFAKYSAPAAVYAKAPLHQDYYAEPKYEYHYQVADSHTGDQKSQYETRDGDVTKGQYSFVEADGTIRTVDYSVDGHSGFNAVVSRSGHASHPQGAPVKAVYASPAKAIVASPLLAAPVAHGYYKH